jgi:hypothetical protein
MKNDKRGCSDLLGRMDAASFSGRRGKMVVQIVSSAYQVMLHNYYYLQKNSCFPRCVHASPLPPGAGQLEKREGINRRVSLSLLAFAPGGRGVHN